MSSQMSLPANDSPLEAGQPPFDTVLEQTDLAGTSAIRLSSGRSVEVAENRGGETLTIRGVGGGVELRVTLTDRGPVLHFEAAELAMSADGRVAFDCDEFEVRTRRQIQLDAGGDLQQQARGNASVVAGDAMHVEGTTCSARARLGDVSLQANDDVRVKGERIRLNC